MHSVIPDRKAGDRFMQTIHKFPLAKFDSM